MKLNPTPILLSLCLSVAGCSFHYDVSKLKPFSEYSGRDVVLQRPACLVEEWLDPKGQTLLFHLNEKMAHSGYFMFDSRRTKSDKVLERAGYGGSHVYLTPIETIPDHARRYTMWGQQKECGWNFLIYKGEAAFGTYTAKFWTLPAGTSYAIDTVNVDGNPFAGPFTTVVGRLTLPGTQEEVTVSYNWAAGFNLHRAPWEDENIPDQRYIGYKGNEYNNKVD